MKCQLCGDRSVSRFCSFCDKLYFKEEKLRKPTKKKQAKKPKQPICKKVCNGCKKEYMPKRSNQLFCSLDCRPKPMTEAEKWLNAKPRFQNLDSDQVAYGFFRKKYGVSNRLRICRG